VPDADEAIMRAALVSTRNRQNQLMSILHDLTVDSGASAEPRSAQ
jgi:hypothetical protein